MAVNEIALPQRAHRVGHGAVEEKLGKPVGGTAPFSYRWHEQPMMPDQGSSPGPCASSRVIREHRRKKAVARILNGRGYRTRNGPPFSDTIVTHQGSPSGELHAHRRPPEELETQARSE